MWELSKSVNLLTVSLKYFFLSSRHTARVDEKKPNGNTQLYLGGGRRRGKEVSRSNLNRSRKIELGVEVCLLEI